MMSVAQVEALRELNSVAQSGDADAVESAVFNAFDAGFSPDFVPALLTLIPRRDHTRHEDIVSALQELRDPRAVEALYDAALVDHEYLAYDEFFGLARKCTWALADIGTPEAHSRLQALAKHNNSQIAAYARKRLKNWDDERDRKGG